MFYNAHILQVKISRFAIDCVALFQSISEFHSDQFNLQLNFPPTWWCHISTMQCSTHQSNVYFWCVGGVLSADIITFLCACLNDYFWCALQVCQQSNFEVSQGLSFQCNMPQRSFLHQLMSHQKYSKIVQQHLKSNYSLDLCGHFSG